MTTEVVTREQIGRRIAMARRERGWTQAGLAEQLNRELGTEGDWNATRVSKIETAVLGVDADVLALIASVEQFPIWWYYEVHPTGNVPELSRVSSGVVVPFRKPAKRVFRPISQSALLMDPVPA